MIGNFLSVAMKVLILFLLMSVGFVLGRKKIITETGTDQMNFLLLNVVVPCVIIDALEFMVYGDRRLGVCFSRGGHRKILL